jgi:tetratricopeptide (TPR) repeat protein
MIRKSTTAATVAMALMLTAEPPALARSALLARGRADARDHHCDRAIALFSQAITEDPADKAAYEARGLCYALDKQKRYDLARADFDAIIRLDPGSGRAFTLRGAAYECEQDYTLASADFARAISLSPDDAQAYTAAAWLMATCPDSKFRNGPKAVEFATRSCDLSSWRLPYTIDTLAAASAEDGKFDDAIKWETKAIETFAHWRDVDASLKLARDRLELYKAHTAYRHSDCDK